MKRFFVFAPALLLIIVLLLIIITEYKQYKIREKVEMITFKTPLAVGLQEGKEYKIKKIRVQKGHEFEIYIFDYGWIKAQLEKSTPTMAQKSVIDLINLSTNPKVILLEKKNEIWTVDIKLTVDKKELDLESWLKDQNLLFY